MTTFNLQAAVDTAIAEAAAQARAEQEQADAATINALNAQVATLNDAIAVLEAQAQADAATITAKNAEIADLNAEVAQLEARIAELEASSPLAFKPALTNPLVVTVPVSGSPINIDADGQDVIIQWPNEPSTITCVKITDSGHIHCIGGHFKPTGQDDTNQGALEFQNIRDGKTVYLERMEIDLSARSHKPSIYNDAYAIDAIPITGDAIGFGGVVSATAPTYPNFAMVRSIMKGVSGQHPAGCNACSAAHADGFQLRGPIGDVTFKDVHTDSVYQGLFLAPANDYYGTVLEPPQQIRTGAVIRFDNVTATVKKPAGLTTAEAAEWRSRAVGYYLESYALRSQNKMSYFPMEIGPGGLWLEIPTDESNWLNFIGGKTVLHHSIDADTASIDYIPDGILRRGRSPNCPTVSMTGPGSAPIAA